MALPNLSFLRTPKTKTLDTLGGIFDIAVSGSATCEPKHCGVCGECRQFIYVEFGENGEPHGTVLDNGLLTNINYQITLGDDEGGDPRDNTDTVAYWGKSFKSLDKFEAFCPEGECFDAVLGTINTSSYLSVPIPLGFIRNETECLQYAASRPSGESVVWQTTVRSTANQEAVNRGYSLNMG